MAKDQYIIEDLDGEFKVAIAYESGDYENARREIDAKKAEYFANKQSNG